MSRTKRRINRLQKSLRVLLTAVLLINSTQIPVLAESPSVATNRLEPVADEINLFHDRCTEDIVPQLDAIQPEITIDYNHTFIIGEHFDFTVKSDRSGLLTISVLYGASSFVHIASEFITQSEDFDVVIDAMPNASEVSFVITVRPVNEDFDGALAVSSMEIVRVNSENEPDEEVVNDITLEASLEEEVGIVENSAVNWPANWGWSQVADDPFFLTSEPLVGNPDWISSIFQGDQHFSAFTTSYSNGMFRLSTPGNGRLSGTDIRGTSINKAIPGDANFRIGGWITIDTFFGQQNNQSAVGFAVFNELWDTGRSGNGGGNVAPFVFSGAHLTGNDLDSPVRTARQRTAYPASPGATPNTAGVAGAQLYIKQGMPFYAELVRVGNQFVMYVNGTRQTLKNNVITGDDFGNIYIGMLNTRGMDASFRQVSYNVMPASSSFTGIELISQDPVYVAQNAEFDLEKIEIRVNYTDGYFITNAAQVHLPYGAPITSHAGMHKFAVSYMGHALTIDYEVQDNPIKEMRVMLPPSRIEYRMGQTFDPSGLIIRIIRESGAFVDVDHTALHDVFIVEGWDDIAWGSQGNIRIVYTQNTDVYASLLIRKLDSSLEQLEVLLPSRLVYYQGNPMPTEFDLLRGISVFAAYTDGFRRMLDQTQFTTNFGATSFNDGNTSTWQNAGVETLIINYEHITYEIDFTVHVVESVGLTIYSFPYVTTYTIGDDYDLTGIVVHIINNDGSVLTNISGDYYDVDTSAFNINVVGLYPIYVSGRDGTPFEGLAGQFYMSVMENLNPTTGWEFRRFGESATINGNFLRFLDRNNFSNVLEDVTPDRATGTIIPDNRIGEMNPDTVIELETILGRGKVTNGGQDGINYYFYRLPYWANFRLVATMELVTLGQAHIADWPNHQQQSFGIMFRDLIAEDGDTDTLWSSIFMIGPHGSGNPVAPRWRDLEEERFTQNTNPMPVAGYDINLFPTPIWNPANTGSGNPNANVFHIVLEKSNNMFSGSMTINGVTQAWEHPHAINFRAQDALENYIGVFTARDAHARFYDVDLTVTDGRAQAPGPVVLPTPITPAMQRVSPNIVESLNETVSYEFRFTTNANGIANVYYNSERILENHPVQANRLMSAPAQTISSQTMNRFSVDFIPHSLGNYTNFNRISQHFAIDLVQVESADLYVTPDGAEGEHTGLTRDNPTTLADATRRIAPGSTIIMTPGRYNTSINIPFGNNGNEEDGYKRIFAEPGVLMQPDSVGIISSANHVINGDFWHLQGLEIHGRVSVGGNDNIFELLTIRDGAETGLQISRQHVLGHAANDIAAWPSRNLVLNTESFGHKDPGSTNADGFASKITSGEGNRFIGSIAHHNVDDGWDFFSRGTTIGAVVIDYSIAYRNGRLLHDPAHPGADGNGFKLGGEGVPVPHVVRNSIAFENKSNGFSSNSNPSLTISRSVGFDNFGANINLYSRAFNNFRDYLIDNFFSYRRNVVGHADVIEVFCTDTNQLIRNLNIAREQWNDVPHSIYLGNGQLPSETNRYMNDLGRRVTDNFFYSLDAPGWTISDGVVLSLTNRLDFLHNYNYAFDHSITGGEPAIILGDFLRLTDFAGYHDRQHTVSFEVNRGVPVEKQTVFYREKIAEVDIPIREGHEFLGWYEDALFTTPWEWDFAVDIVERDKTIYARFEGEQTNEIAPTITTAALPNGVVGQAYNQLLEATGDNPIIWRVTDGSLPDGLILNATTGVISGMPMTRGTFNFTIRAENNAGYTTQAFTLTIEPSTILETPEDNDAIPPTRPSDPNLPQTGTATAGVALLGVVFITSGFTVMKQKQKSCD